MRYCCGCCGSLARIPFIRQVNSPHLQRVLAANGHSFTFPRRVVLGQTGATSPRRLHIAPLACPSPLKNALDKRTTAHTSRWDQLFGIICVPGLPVGRKTTLLMHFISCSILHPALALFLAWAFLPGLTCTRIFHFRLYF